jgi:outer membrane protein assembly factor BamB
VAERDQRQVSPSRLAEHGGRLYTFELSLTRPVGWLITLDPATGRVVRTVPLPAGLVSYHPPAVVDGIAWFGSITLGEYLDEEPAGAVLCRADDDGITVVADLAAEPAGQPLVAGGVLYLATASGVLHAFDTATALQCWRFDTGHPADSFLGPFHAVGDGVVYAGVKNGIVALTGDE